MKTISITTEGIIIDGKAPKFVRMYDYTGCKPDLCTNGGAYWFWKTLRFLEDGTVFLTSRTSAEFNICEESQILTMAEAARMIVGFVANMDNIDTFVDVC